MTDARIVIDGGAGTRSVALTTYLDPASEETATVECHAWIKRLRHAIVDGVPLRRRFTFREDSLWWFAELYLHKERIVLEIFRTLIALERLIAAERPVQLRVAEGGRLVRVLTRSAAIAHGIRYVGPDASRGPMLRLRAMDVRAQWQHTSALASRRRGQMPAADNRSPAVAAFVHRAFWRSGVADGSAEAYIGPILEALERRLGADAIRYVSVGPSLNFRARRWWHLFRHGAPPDAAPPIEAYAPVERLGPSRAVWRQRHALRRALWSSGDLRTLANIRGCDCWPIIREELAGIALLQWPWSARAMDEAAAALDALRPQVVITYAEAGGWGRALLLEARRRNIPSAGLQHGFIYRHWLNYLHEPDEMQPDESHPGDRGFPRPSRTLLFDHYAAQHLVEAGRFPAESIEVTGSPRLDGLIADLEKLSAADIERARSATRAGAADALVLVATKQKEARGILPALVAGAKQVPNMHLVIKTHPAETPDVYAEVAANQPHVTVLPASAPLAPLLRASRAVVTVNSTVALDATVAGIPALVVGLPSNLTPFVDAAVMAGAGAAGVTEALNRILYDEEFRCVLARAGRDFLSRLGMSSDGRATERTVDAVLRLVTAVKS
jgi:Capsule polysaccharide biosynthesis protein